MLEIEGAFIMTLTVPNPVSTQQRRSHPRKQGLAYVDFGAGNAGILSNLSECGLAFNGIGVLEKGQTFPFRFTMPGRSDFIEATGQVVWLSDSKKSGGLRFLELPEEIRSQIRAWSSISTIDRSENIGGASAGEREPTLETPAISAALSKQPEGRSGLGFAAATSEPGSALAHSSDGNPQEFQPYQAAPEPVRLPIPGSNPYEEEIVPVRVELPRTSIPAEGQFTRAEGADNAGVSHLPSEIQAELNSPIVPAEPVRTPEVRQVPIAPPLDHREALEADGSGVGESSKNLRFVSPQELAKKSERGETPQPPSSPSTVRPLGRLNETTGSQPPSQLNISKAMAPPADLKLAAGQAQERRWQGQSLSAPKPASIPAQGAKVAPRPTGEASKTGSTAVLSRAAKQREILKTSQALRFIAGVAVGCVALATIAGGLVATGKLRLVDLTPATSNTTEATRIQDPGEQQQTAENSQSNGILTGTQPEVPTTTVPTKTRTHAPAVAASIPAPSSTARPAAATRKSTALPQKPPAAPRQARVADPVVDSARTAPGSGASAPVSNGADASAFEPPLLVSYTEPIYPPAARAAQIQGNVEVVATIGRDGVPRSLRVTSGDPQLGAAAIAAISNWRYRPATVNGQFEESLITIAVKFAL